MSPIAGAQNMPKRVSLMDELQGNGGVLPHVLTTLHGTHTYALKHARVHSEDV